VRTAALSRSVIEPAFGFVKPAPGGAVSHPADNATTTDTTAAARGFECSRVLTAILRKRVVSMRGHSALAMEDESRERRAATRSRHGGC
jgi:hypothetical protein